MTNPADAETEFEQLDEKAQAEVTAGYLSRDQAPDILYHYTDWNGLDGIVRNGKIWATDSEHLNDVSELRHVMDVVQDQCLDQQTLQRLQTPMLAGYLASMTRDHATSRPYHTFLACFSQRSDDLAQWRGYADDGAGFAMGLDLAALPGTKVPGLSDLELARVVYDENTQGRAVRDTWIPVVELFDKWWQATPRNDRGELAERALAISLRVTARLAWWMKHAAFASEEEWRLMTIQLPMPPAPASMGPIASQLRFRRSGHGVTPFIEMPLDPTANGVPLREIVLGPRLDDADERAVALYLRTLGHAQVRIRRSQAPYR